MVIFGLIGALLLAVGIVVLLAAIRFFSHRSRGTQVLVRTLPAGDTRGWRHGVIRYSGEDMEFYKLRSLNPSCDMRFDRRVVTYVGTRPLDDDEASFIVQPAEAVHLRIGTQDVEIALEPDSALALNAWIESAPSPRQERTDLARLRARSYRGRGTTATGSKGTRSTGTRSTGTRSTSTRTASSRDNGAGAV